MDNNDSRLDDKWNAEAEGRSSIGERHDDAVKNGRAAEEAATSEESGGFYKSGDAKEKEQAKGGLYRSSVANVAKGTRFNLRGGKGKGALAALLVTIAITGGAFSVIQSAAPFGFIDNAKEWLNSISVSHRIRATSLFKDLFSSKKKGDSETPKAFSSDTEEGGKFVLSDEMKAQLKKNGMEVVDPEGLDTEVMVFKDNKGELYFIAANEDDLAKIPDTIKVDGKEVSAKSKMTLDAKLSEDTSFLSKFTSSIQHWKGQIAGWYDSLSGLYHERIGNNRDKFHGKDLNKEITKEELIDAVHKNGVDEKIEKTKGDPEYGEADEETGEVKEGKEKVSTDDDSLSKDLDKGGVEKSLSGRAKKAAAAASKGSAIVCAVVKAAGAIDSAVTAMNMIKVLNFATAVMETVDKAKAGDGAGAMLTMFKELSMPGDTQGIVDGEWKTVRTGTSTLQSPAWSQFFGGAPVKNSDPVMSVFGSGNVIANALSSKNWGILGGVVGNLGQSMADFGGSAEATRACLAMDAAGNLADIAEKVGGFMTMGPIGILLDVVIDIGKQALIDAVVGKIVEFVVPTLASSIAIDIVSNMAGEQAGYALSAGVNIYMGHRHIATSGMIGSEAQIAEQDHQAQLLAAEQARIDRYELSPFDATNKNTFLGSIAYAMMPTYFNLSAPVMAASNFLKLTARSMGSLIPVAEAAGGKVGFRETIDTECSMGSLKASDGGKAIGGVGCYPRAYQSTKYADWSTLDVYQEMKNKGYLEDSGDNPKVKGGSRYDLWLRNCTTRMSKWGYVSTQVDTGEGNSGGLGDVLKQGIEKTTVGQLIDDFKEQANVDWATGQECLTGADVELFGEYNLRQEMLESGGIIDKSSTTAFFEDYYREHPIDHSLEGQIAMYTGMSKEQVDETLGLMEYVDYIAHYDADGLAPVAPPTETRVVIEDDSPVAAWLPEAILGRRVVYADLREQWVTA